MDERDVVFQEPPRQQTMPAEIVLSVSILVLFRLFRDVKHFTLLHQLQSLLVIGDVDCRLADPPNVKRNQCPHQFFGFSQTGCDVVIDEEN